MIRNIRRLTSCSRPSKVEVLEEFGQVIHNGRSYKIARERVSSGQVYISLKLYNAQGKFIKRFMIDEDIAPKIGAILIDPKCWAIDKRFPALFKDEEYQNDRDSRSPQALQETETNR